MTKQTDLKPDQLMGLLAGAKVLWAMYNSYKEVGFTSSQALELVKINLTVSLSQPINQERKPDEGTTYM